MRIDKFLKLSRIIKRRTLAEYACEQGRVMINGKTVKPAARVKANDVIDIRFGDKTTSIKVLDVEERTLKFSPEDAYVIM